MALDVTVSGLSSTSYVTLAEALQFLDYASEIPIVEEFLAADVTEEQREKALEQSAFQMEYVEWPGEKTKQDQALAWPRRGVAEAMVNEIPVRIKRAQSVFAAYVMDDNARWLGFDSGSESSATKRLKIGDFEMEFQDDQSQSFGGIALPNPVRFLLGPLFKAGSKGQRRIWRA